uniref:Uncharacterized protein n=1 Tax=Rhizophora mucronata TaxID=61149 RepID=A0A2P2P2A7_RHIMU
MFILFSRSNHYSWVDFLLMLQHFHCLPLSASPSQILVLCFCHLIMMVRSYTQICS